MIVDTNVHLSRWPFRRLPGDETADLVASLRRENVVEAWAASFDGVLHKDIGGVNARLAKECRLHGGGFLVPFGCVNPQLPGWQEDLRRCADDYRMPGIRLYPNYHQYGLDAPAFAQLLRLATQRKLIVQVSVTLEDSRTQHPLVRVPPVDLAPLPHVLQQVPGARVMLLNWRVAFDDLPLESLARLVFFDIAAVEGAAGVARLVEQVPAARVLFGSHAPFFYFEAALLKLQESGLGRELLARISEVNARELRSRGETA